MEEKRKKKKKKKKNPEKNKEDRSYSERVRVHVVNVVNPSDRLAQVLLFVSQHC